MIRVGIVGFGFMGRMHLGCWMQMPDVEVAAICDTNPNVAKTVQEQIGNIPGLPEQVDMSAIKFYTDFAAMLSQEQLDAVSITLPTHLHADLTCQALEAGVHVLCEKPMALDAQQCRKMIDAAAKTGKCLMIAHCIRFWPEYADTRDIIHSGKYGRVLIASFQRLSARPTWSSGNWLMDPRHSGGMMLDLHIHDADYIHCLFGMPLKVSCQAITPHGIVEHVKADYFYDNDMLVSAEASWLVSDSFGFRMNYEIVLEKAMIVYDCSRDPVYRVCPQGDKPFSPSVSEKDGYFHEIEYFLQWIQGTIENDRMPMEQSLKSVLLIEAEKTSLGTGKPVTIGRCSR